MKRFEGQSLSIIFAVMSTSVPERNPGFLSEKEYVGVLAYIHSLSRYAPGEVAYNDENGALNAVIVAARKRKWGWKISRLTYFTAALLIAHISNMLLSKSITGGKQCPRLSD